ncbi:DNA-binding CsgD family transcriptional regulator [Catenulispora sp. GP43]|uniref:helix-turn-helix transcriptional regulator n=1 Tax=Catenulispora sp. GP43 TaxID=3156263 RepID=UPI003517F907
MVARGSATPSLMRWGLSPSADLVYRSLNALGGPTLEQLAVSLEWPVRDVREALEELHDVGGCHPARGPVRRWKAAEPGVVADALRRRHHRLAVAGHALRRQLTRLEGFAVEEGDLSAALGTTIRPLFGDTRRTRLKELVVAERCEYLAMNPEPAFDHQAVKTAAPLDRLLCERGQAFSLGVPPTVEDRSGGLTQELITLGMQYRELPELPAKLVIIDRATALTPINPGDPRQGFWEITTPEVVHRLLDLYMRRWRQGIAPRKRWTPPMTLTPRERAVLSLLAEGFTDDTVAAHLGLSRRTIAYTVAELMERYGARNRFQLGLYLSDLNAGTADADLDPLTEPEPELKPMHKHKDKEDS